MIEIKTPSLHLPAPFSPIRHSHLQSSSSSPLFAVFALWLHPGSLSWAISKFKTAASTIASPACLPSSGCSMYSLSRPLTEPSWILLIDLSSHWWSSLWALRASWSLAIRTKEILSSVTFADWSVKQSTYELLFHRAGFAPYGKY